MTVTRKNATFTAQGHQFATYNKAKAYDEAATKLNQTIADHCPTMMDRQSLFTILSEFPMEFINALKLMARV